LRVNTDGVSLTGYQKLLLAFHLWQLQTIKFLLI
jgi:hypothetical protein